MHEGRCRNLLSRKERRAMDVRNGYEKPWRMILFLLVLSSVHGLGTSGYVRGKSVAHSPVCFNARSRNI